MMNIYSNIRIAYYSGTGGTELAARSFQSSLETAGCVCTTERITSKTHPLHEDHDLLLLLFPVHAFNAPNAVYQWISGLNTVNRTSAAVISVSGGGEVSPNTACRVESIRRLTRKGYHVIHDSMIVMPSNWASPTPNPLPYLLLQALPIAVEQIASDLLSGVTRTSKPIWIDRVFTAMGKLETIGARFWGRRIKVLDHCTTCGWCAKNCPAGNITMRDGKPTFGKQCHFCMKCLYGCPARALQPGVGRFVMIKEGYSLSDMAKKSEQYSSISLDDIDAKSLWEGVRKYLAEVQQK